MDPTRDIRDVTRQQTSNGCVAYTRRADQRETCKREREIGIHYCFFIKYGGSCIHSGRLYD
jgi:hypothetical protein